MSEYFSRMIPEMNIVSFFSLIRETCESTSLKLSCKFIDLSQKSLKIFSFQNIPKPLNSNIYTLSSQEIRSSIYKYIYSVLSPNDSKKQPSLFGSGICKVVLISSAIFSITLSLFQEILNEIVALFYKKNYFKPVPYVANNRASHDDFLKGVSTCTYQDSGNFPNSQWHEWEKKVIQNPQNRSNHSANLFTLYQTNPMQIIDRLKQLNINSYRFSVEWSQIEPNQGEYRNEVIQVYKDLCSLLKKNGIIPMVTLHHFSEPAWFHQLGSFENEENISYFENFSQKIAEELSEVHYFCTINEPNIEAFSRFIRGAFSPGLFMQFTRALTFLKGAFLAHNRAYEKIKATNPLAQVGFTHQYLRFTAGFFLITPITDILTRFVNDLTLKILRKGQARLKIPFIINKKITLEIKTDFVGLQYYTRPIISFTGSTTSDKKEKMTLMPFREDPEGLYEAIEKVHEASKKPIIVTENGISTLNPIQRKRYIESAIKIIKLFSKEKLKGFFLWSFTKNFEWDMGMDPQNFGAFDLLKKEGQIELSESPKPGLEDFIHFNPSN